MKTYESKVELLELSMVVMSHSRIRGTFDGGVVVGSGMVFVSVGQELSGGCVG